MSLVLLPRFLAVALAAEHLAVGVGTAVDEVADCEINEIDFHGDSFLRGITSW